MRACALVVVLLGLVFLLPGCASRFSLGLDEGKAIEAYNLTTHTRSTTLRPGTSSYRKLADWLAKNQSGWKRYIATPPAQGWVVSVARNYRLQFLGKVVILHGPDGVWIKDVSPGDYFFLKR